MCFDTLLTRRQIFSSIMGMVAYSELGWAMRAEGISDPETIILPDSVDQYTPSFFKRAFESIDNIAKHAGASVRIAFASATGDMRSLTLLFKKKDKKGYAFPMLRKEDGSTLSLAHAGHGSLNRIEFLSPNREFLTRLKERTKQFFAVLKERIETQDALTLGIKAVAIGIGAWIGIQLAGFVFAALGFLLYYALIVALVIAGAMVIESLFQKRFSIHERRAKIKEQFIQRSANFPELVGIVAG